MKIKKLISSLLGVLFLLSSTGVSRAKVFDVSYQIQMVEEQRFPSFYGEGYMMYPDKYFMQKTEYFWIRDLLFPTLTEEIDIRRKIPGNKSNTIKFLLIYKKIWPMCISFLHMRDGEEITDSFVKRSLDMYSPVCRKRWGNKWGLAAIVWGVYHRVPCMSHEMGFIADKSSDYKELILNMENLCLAYYQLAYNREYYRGIALDYLKDTLEFNRTAV